MALATMEDRSLYPPNATLHIDLELVSWKRVALIGDDKRILKKVLKEGGGYERPNDGSGLRVRLIGKLEDGTVFAKKGHEGDEPFEFRTDEEQVIQGLDTAIATMKKAEVALVRLPPEHAFGSTETKPDAVAVPPDSTLFYEVELVSFDKGKEIWDLNSNREKIEATIEKKDEGDVLFNMGKYAKASKRYEKAARFIEHVTSFSEEEKKQFKALMVSIKLDNVACKLELGDYREAEKLCTKVLELESANVTALYRRAQAYTELVDMEIQELDIKKALELDPNNRYEGGPPAAITSGEIGQSTKHKNISDVWEGFTKILAPGASTLTVCSHCSRILTGDSEGSTSCVAEHKCS